VIKKHGILYFVARNSEATKDLTTVKRFDIIKELLINKFLRDLEKWTARRMR
jgi:hypothetical protein